MMRYLIFLTSFLLMQYTVAQDARLSHTWNQTSELNPALTGISDRQIRLGAFYRLQWLSIPDPYQYYGGIADINYRQVGVGLSVFSNHAGPASLNVSKVKVTGAWHVQLTSKAKLSIGLGAGMLQKRINPSVLKFDKQFIQGVGFDGNNNHGEEFLFTNIIKLDLGAGANIHLPLSNRFDFKGGFAIDHFNQPKFSFIDARQTGVHTKWTGYTSVEYKASDLLLLTPRAIVRQQGPAREILLSLQSASQINDNNLLKLGFSNRFKDAFIINAGIKFQRLEAGFSYDINTSGLHSVTRGSGAFEFMILYAIANPKISKKIKPKKEEAPQGIGIPQPIDLQMNDMDEDGISDENDQCPSLFGSRENAGCPVKLHDTDGDGLLDEIDNCRFIKGLPKHGGCPDTDQDGIIDLEDNCPYLKGISRLKGCPPEITKLDNPPTKNTPEKLPLENITIFFDTDQTVIRSEYHNSLKSFASILRDYPSVRIFLAGHTDTEGNAAYNFSLSERRSLSVRYFLVSNGVDPAQIRQIAYGETIPRTTNNTIDGMSENRRVEIIIVWP